MRPAEKRAFVSSRSDAALDTFFGVRPVTDVAREGAEELYLQGLTPEALYTSYHDLLAPMQWLHSQGARRWCDLGCGVGRTCLLWSWLFPDGESVGVEMVPERLEEARSSARGKNLANTLWVEGDFASHAFTLPPADVYFLYLATGPALDALLGKLKREAPGAWVVVVESHGDLRPRLQWEGWWLSPHLQRFPLSSHRHDPWMAFYRVAPHAVVAALEQSWQAQAGILPAELEKHPSPLGYLLSKSNHTGWELVVEEKGEMWTMDTLGLRWHDAVTVQGAHPPRQVAWGSVRVGLRQIPETEPYRQWVRWRRAGTRLGYQTRIGQSGQGILRKIVLSPRMSLEFSDGNRIEWGLITSLEPLP